MQIQLKLLKTYCGDSPAYSGVCYPSCNSSFPESMLKTQEGMTALDFVVQLQTQTARDELSLAYVRCITKATHIPAMSVFDTLTEI
jgi:hypothetical protein